MLLEKAGRNPGLLLWDILARRGQAGRESLSEGLQHIEFNDDIQILKNVIHVGKTPDFLQNQPG
jgi:hypothetical protein